MTLHIGAAPETIADTVLLPGDPLRARWAAHTFLSDVEPIHSVRGMLGFTGTWNGQKVSIQGTGMGMPSLSIYVNELITGYNVQTLIRIGSCGGMQDHVELRDIVLAMASSSVSTPSSTILKELSYAPIADWTLLRNAVRSCETQDIRHHIGGIYSSDTFYSDRQDLDQQLVRHGILAVEMEAAELYSLAARYNRRALAILTVSDHLNTDQALSADDREHSFSDMVAIALETAFPEAANQASTNDRTSV